MAALQGALGLRVAGLEDDPAEAELAAVGGEGLCRAPAAGVDRALAVPDELLGQGAEAGEAAVHAPGDVAELLGEDQRASEGARVGKLGKTPLFNRQKWSGFQPALTTGGLPSCC